MFLFMLSMSFTLNVGKTVFMIRNKIICQNFTKDEYFLFDQKLVSVYMY